MAEKLLTLLGLFIGTIIACSQTSKNTEYILDKSYFKSKGAVFVPTGSYKDASNKIISVQAFFLTNQITNKEFRKFTDYVKSNPDSSLYYIDFKKLVKAMKDTTIRGRSFYIQQVPFKQIQNSLIDSFAMAKKYASGSDLHNKYKNYFTDQEFDDFPVVGVPWEVAKYYCIWRTAQENEVLKNNGTGLINDFRLPTKEEFMYAESFSPNFKNESGREIRKSKSGKADKLGAYNLFGNVDEWISPWNDAAKKIVKTVPGDNGVQETSNAVGFRMVSTYVGKSKDL